MKLKCGDLISIIGENNSGKSNLIQALDLFFDPSVSKVTEESFYEKVTTEPIEIRVDFKDLNQWEREYFSRWLHVDRLKVKRKITWNGAPKISHIQVKDVPDPEWLQEDLVNGNKVAEWWKDKPNLSVAGHDFCGYLSGQKPSVKEWNSAISSFLKDHEKDIPWKEIDKEDPTGFANVLKGGLPELIPIPAVRDVLDELKVGKTNPFGRLINTLLSKIPEEQKSKIAEAVTTLRKLVHKGHDQERIQAISETEKLLEEMMCHFIDCKIEIRVQVPNIESMFAGVEIFVDDGFPTSIETKGHGLQRSLIFAILRAYAELVRADSQDEKKKERSIIFAIEEPELYLHPQAQRAMMQALRLISSGKDQIVYSTHLDAFIDIGHFDEICLLRRENINGHWKSIATQLKMDDLITDLKIRYPATTPTYDSMRDRYSHVCGGTRTEGFFARKVVLVEGPTEEYSLPLYAAALGYDMDKEGVSVIGSGGKGQMDRLLRVFNEFGIACYAIFDADCSEGDNQSRQANEQLLELLGATPNPRPPTAVQAKYSVFQEKFETIMKAEIPEYDALTDEARTNLGITSDSGKPLVARYMARKLIAKGRNEGDLSKYVPNTLKAIVQKIKELRWEGSVLRRQNA